MSMSDETVKKEKREKEMERYHKDIDFYFSQDEFVNSVWMGYENEGTPLDMDEYEKQACKKIPELEKTIAECFK